MTIQELTKKVVEHGEEIAELKTESKTLFKRQDKMDELIKSVQEIALSVQKLTDSMKTANDRIKNIEDEKQKKSFAVWQIIASAIIGGLATYCVSMFF